MSHATAFCYRRSNDRCWVVPYVRGRLVYAEAAVKTLQKNVFDNVLLDLPAFMNHGSWLDAPLDSFPLVSSLLVQGDEETCSLLPLIPTDAACATAWFAKNRSLSFECVDPVLLLDRSCQDIPAIASLGDERFVSRMSLKSHFEKAWDQLDTLWENSPDSSVKNLILHGNAVANRIHDRISSGRKVLFVCEYRVWWAVRRALDMGVPIREESAGNSAPPPERSCALLLEDPYFMWSAGMFDDYLTVNKKFHESLRSESVASFNKYEALAELMGSVSKECDSMIARNDAGKISSLALNSRSKTKTEEWTDLSSPQSFESVRSKLGAEAEAVLSRLLLDYPMPTVLDTANNPPQYFKIAEDKMVPDTASFDLPDVFHANPYGEFISARETETAGVPARSKSFGFVSWLSSVHPFLTRQEAKELDENNYGSRFAVKRDYVLHAYACQIIRQAAMREASADPDNEELGVFTPISFIFSNGHEKPGMPTVISDNNLTQRQIDLGCEDRIYRKKMPPPDSVYSLYATKRACDSLFEEHIQRESITSLTLLFSGSEMGLERYAAIMQRPEKFQCRKRPQQDPELRGFRCSDLGLAWAIKYAEKNVIAAAGPGWEPSPIIQKFAQKRKKRILTLSLDLLPGDLANRLQQLHFISASLKRHPECEKIVARFVG